MGEWDMLLAFFLRAGREFGWDGISEVFYGVMVVPLEGFAQKQADA